MTKYLDTRKLFLVFMMSIFSCTVFLEVFSLETTTNSLESKDSPSHGYDLRLMSFQPSQRNVSPYLNRTESSLFSSLTKKNPNVIKTSFNSTGTSSSHVKIPLPTNKITSNPDLDITKITPEAMEKNASSMTFVLNFTIPDSIGLGIDVIEDLVLNNGSDIPINLSDSIWVELKNETGHYIENYSLTFVLDDDFLSNITLGSYDLIMNISVLGYPSSDSIPLPMRDLQVSFEGTISPPEFNNKLDTDQIFSVEILVRNVTHLGPFPVDYLPLIPDENGNDTNPSATIKSTSKVGSLQLLNKTYNPAEATFTLNYCLTPDVARKFDDGDHQFIISVTTTEGISDTRNKTFSAKGTVYFAILEELTVETNPPINYDSLMVSTQDEVKFRLNVNDSITISFHVYDAELEKNSTERHDIGYQDPNNPEDPSAILYKLTEIDGTGNITLSANDITPTSGYQLLFFVRGHRTSQANDEPSNITIFWDLLHFNYTYFDNQGREGTSTDPDEKSLGVDVNASWSLELGLYYASDGSPALGGNISYKFGKGIWKNLTDDPIEDAWDGLFEISYMHPNASEVVFECQIVSGSKIDPQGTLFVDKTVGAAYFNLTVTWTYLIIDMVSSEPDSRLSTLETTDLLLTATWAHNASLPFYGILTVEDVFRDTQIPVSMVAGEGKRALIPHIITGDYPYIVLNVVGDENFLGITKFTNSSVIQIENPQVQVIIIWEEIDFTCSDTYDPEIPPDQQTWGVERFFTNHGENGTLYVYGRHSYDNSPFNGTAVLYAFEIAKGYTLTFTNGVARWSDDLTEWGFEITFGIMEIYEDIDFGVRGVGITDDVIISWDKIIITLEADMAYSHGTWADINVSFKYLVATESVNLSTVKYDLLLSNDTPYFDISWIHFRDYSFGTDVRSYNITSLYDFSTGLTGFETRYKWHDQEIEQAGNLTICWIDDKDPSILEFGAYDFGNGTILLIVDVTDDSEDWKGSGISRVELFDKRSLIDQPFPGKPLFYQVSPGVYRYFFSYTYNQPGLPDLFQFDFNDTLEFSFVVTDKGTLEFPEWLEDLRNPQTVETPLFSIVTNYDTYKPQFIKKDGVEINVSFITLDNASASIDINDGDTVVSVTVKDAIWSGLTNSSVRLIVIEWSSSNVIINKTMRLIDNRSDLVDKRSEFQFSWQGNLKVFETYQLTVIVTDNAGNVNTRTLEAEVEDIVPPRVKKVESKQTGDRKLRIIVEIEETGGGIDYIMVKIGDQDRWFNLSREGGIGGTGAAVPETVTYTAIIPLDFDPLNIIQVKSYSITIKVADKIGNHMEFASDEYDFIDDFRLSPFIFEPIVLILGFILLAVGIVVGIRITSKTVGYDMKKIIAESERITREVMLTNMDEYALGVTVNFFDQVQGPVPVIWEPPLLEDQEQVMLDLSDKSFSALEFVGLEEKERSGTFDFSTGSYECTALGYSFAIANPKARGGKENLTVVLLLRKEWGDNLLVFQDELLEKLREIRELIESQQPSSTVEKKARQLREFVSKIMIAFSKIYTGIEYEVGSSEE